MVDRLGDGPIQAKYRDMMNRVARLLDRFFNGFDEGAARKTGFILLVFPYGEAEGRCNYISNGARREDVIVMLKEQIARFEGQPEMKGHG